MKLKKRSKPGRNNGKKYEKKLSLYPLTEDEVLDKVFKVDASKLKGVMRKMETKGKLPVEIKHKSGSSVLIEKDGTITVEAKKIILKRKAISDHQKHQGQG